MARGNKKAVSRKAAPPKLATGAAAAVPAGKVSTMLANGLPARKGVVAIVAMGFSVADFLADAMRAGHWSKICDEVWLINTAALVLRGSRAFMMDDALIMGDPNYNNPLTGGNDPTNPTVLDWMKNKADMPVYTSRKRPGFKMAREYPIAEVIERTGTSWFNNSCAYAVALANYERFAGIRGYGMDFYAREAAVNNQGGWEYGIACVTHHMTLAMSDGMNIRIAESSVLMDTGVKTRGQLYGYHEQPRLTHIGGKPVALYGKEAEADIARHALKQQRAEAKAARAAKKGAKT